MTEIIKKTTLGPTARLFWAIFFIVFALTFSLLLFFNLIPQGFKDSFLYFFYDDAQVSDEKTDKSGSLNHNNTGEIPERINIGKIRTDQPIQNPESADIEVLNDALLQGVVRYPGSGLLGEKENIFLFGHSTGLTNVKNPSFLAFNKLNELIPGDEIIVESAEYVYIYRVSSVGEAKASDIKVNFGEGLAKLTLSTCNVFGEKEDRFIVEALFEAKRPKNTI